MSGIGTALLLEAAARRAADYLERLPLRSTRPDAAATDALAAFREPLPIGATDAAAILEMLDTYGSPATMAMAGPRFFGFVTGGALPATVAANWLATAWDQCASFHDVTPAAAVLEDVALGWLRDLLDLPSGCAGAFVTGATMANLTGLAAARHAVLDRAGWNVEADGLIGAPPVTVIVGDEAHPTLMKSLGLLGLGRNRVVRVPVDDQGRLRPIEIPPIDGPTIVCVQAGNVNTGAMDPVADVCELVKPAHAWVHVDGAFGLWAAASDSLMHLTRGLGNADSWATDAHKWLNVPYDSGIAFVRDPDALRAAMAVTADYLPTSPRRNPSEFTPELSRRARGVEVWAALKHLGHAGVGALVDRCCAHARRFAEALGSAGYEILNEVVLNQVLVSFGSAEATRRVIAAVQADGTCWCGGTVWQERTAMRISVSSWATTDDDVDRSIAAIDRAARAVRASRST
jgi:glutamate/tyrosine decarboxylase-like PLP-dependent enzyme